MKNFRFQGRLFPIFTGFALFVVSFIAGCGTIKTLADNFGDNRAARVNSSSSEVEPAPTPNARTNARCQAVLLDARRDKPNDRGELPADLPVPRESVLCGFGNSSRSTYYINDAVGADAVAQFYRDALPPQGFELLMDNPHMDGGRFMNFVRGTSETIMVETKIGTGANFRNIFSVAYMPPRNERGEEITGTMILRRADSNRKANAQAAATPNGNSRNAAACGSNPLGSVACALELQKNVRSWQFSIEDTQSGKRKTYAGEYAKRDRHIRIRFALTGQGRDDGEWWFRFGDNPLAEDNGTRAYRKESGAWVRYNDVPFDTDGMVLTQTAPIRELDGVNIPFLGTENVGGEECNRYRRVIPRQSDLYPEVTLDYWISRRTGYALRRRESSSGNNRLLNVSRQNEINNVESPQPEG